MEVLKDFSELSKITGKEIKVKEDEVYSVQAENSTVDDEEVLRWLERANEFYFDTDYVSKNKNKDKNIRHGQIWIVSEKAFSSKNSFTKKRPVLVTCSDKGCKMGSRYISVIPITSFSGSDPINADRKRKMVVNLEVMGIDEQCADLYGCAQANLPQCIDKSNFLEYLATAVDERDLFAKIRLVRDFSEGYITDLLKESIVNEDGFYEADIQYHIKREENAEEKVMISECAEAEREQSEMEQQFLDFTAVVATKQREVEVLEKALEKSISELTENLDKIKQSKENIAINAERLQNIMEEYYGGLDVLPEELQLENLFAMSKAEFKIKTSAEPILLAETPPCQESPSEPRKYVRKPLGFWTEERCREFLNDVDTLSSEEIADKWDLWSSQENSDKAIQRKKLDVGKKLRGIELKKAKLRRDEGLE